MSLCVQLTVRTLTNLLNTAGRLAQPLARLA